MTFLIQNEKLPASVQLVPNQAKEEEEAVAVQRNHLLILNCADTPVNTKLMEAKRQVQDRGSSLCSTVTESFDSFRLDD